MLAYSTDYEYHDTKHGICLLWTSAYHWRSYTLPGMDYIESLSGDDVRAWLAESGYEWVIVQ